MKGNTGDGAGMQDRAARGRRAWRKPRLVRYGSLQALTSQQDFSALCESQVKDGRAAENNQGRPCPDRRP